MAGGNVVFPSAAVAAAPAPSPPRVVPRYSIDSFAEFSVFALSRAPTTAALPVADAELPARRSTQEQDEELFRDLFAADNDWDAPPAARKHALLQQHKAARPPAPTAGWSSALGNDSGACSPFANPVGAAAFAEKHAPTLSAPVPRLNLAELLNARPIDSGDGAADDAGVWGGRLDQVTETDDEDGDERPESNAEPAASRRRKLQPGGCSSNNNAKLQQETLSFLEKLDLKALLHTPRPDVLDFYPPSTLGGPGGTNQVLSGAEDARVELERAPTYKTKASSTLKPHAPSAGGKKESAETSSRLAHMETTYGTTKHASRKMRKGTIERLANPILGFTSTLQALSPEQRRRREMALGEDGWHPCASSPAAAKARKAAAAPVLSGLDHLTGSTRIYEAAAASSAVMHQRSGLSGSSNQLDDERDYHATRQVPLVKKRSADKKLLGARKAALRKKLENQQPAPPEQTRMSAGEVRVGATFLTQHEDDEAKMSSRGRRPPPARAAAVSTLASQQLSELETRRPRPPASVRATKSTQPARAPAARSERSESSSHQKPKRSAGRPPPPQHPQTPTSAQRKPSTGDRGRPSARRPFPRAAPPSGGGGAAPAKAVLVSTKADSAPKRKPSGAKPHSAAALLLLGSEAAAPPLSASTPTPSKRRGSFAGRQSCRSLSIDVATPARTSQTPHKPANCAGSRVNAAAAGRRGRRSSKDSGGPKSSVTLPAIPPATSRGRQSSDLGARRKQFGHRRTKAPLEGC